MKNRTPTVAFISAFHTPFIQDDIDILSKHFRVRTCIGHGIFQIPKIIFRVFQSDIIFCWFASTYASIAVAVGKFLGIKSVIVVGGVDVAKDEQLKYGIWLSPWKAILVRYAIRNADKVLVVDLSLKEEAILRAEYSGENIQYLPTGYDALFWKPVGEKESSVLTVAIAHDMQRIRLKGIDTLIEVARRMPDVTFIIIGVAEHLLPQLNPSPNVQIRPAVQRAELLPFYRAAKVYCQPSLREGLPNTLCEAMLCGCIPVATNVGGNITAAGDTGIFIPQQNIDALVQAVQRALGMPEQSGMNARARIVGLFPKEKRENELIRVMNGLTR